MKLLILILTSTLVVSCSSDNEKTNSEQLDNTHVATPINNEDSYSFRTTFDENIGWGYQIFINNKLHISQPHIPAIQGNIGFDTEKKAETAATFVMAKIEAGDGLPTLSIQELDSLKVLPDTNAINK